MHITEEGRPTSLLLVRHAETIWNHEHRYAGHSDVPLSPDAEGQIAQLTARLIKEPLTAIYSSPLSRCIATVYPTAEILGLSIQMELGLRERDLGAWEGRSETEIRQTYPEFTFPLDGYNGAYAVPESESMAALERRTYAVLQRIAERNPEGLPLVATHAGLIWVILTHVVTNPPAEPRWPKNTTMLRLTYKDAEFRLGEIMM